MVKSVSSKARGSKARGSKARGSSRRIFVRRMGSMPSQLSVLREAVNSYNPFNEHSMRRAARTALRGPGEYAVLGSRGSPRGYLETYEDAWDRAKHGDVLADETRSEPAYGIFKADSKKRKHRKRRTRRKGRKGGAPPFVSVNEVGPRETARAASQEELVRSVAAEHGIRYESPRRRAEHNTRVADYADAIEHIRLAAASVAPDMEELAPEMLRRWELERQRRHPQHDHSEGTRGVLRRRALEEVVRRDQMRQQLRAERERVQAPSRRSPPVFVENAADPDSPTGGWFGRKVSKGGKGSPKGEPPMREAARVRRYLGPSHKRKRSPSSSEKRRTRRRHDGHDAILAAMKRLHL